MARAPAAGPEQLARVGFVAQDAPTYAGLSVADHLRMGAWLNPRWDRALAERRIQQLHLDPSQRAGKLSGGQRAQLALTVAMAKRPDVLILDEPLASLDPLARREFLQGLMEVVAEYGLSVILSSHLVTDLERVCDYLVVLVASRVQVAGEIDELLASHRRLVGPRRDAGSMPPTQTVIEASHTPRQSTLLVRTDEPIHDPAWTAEQVGLEDLVLAYMARAVAAEQRPAAHGGAVVIRFAVRQFRTQAVVAAVGLAAVGVTVLATGPHLVHLYDTTVARCGSGQSCFLAADAFGRNDRLLQIVLGLLLLMVPALIGIFWGAPLVARELETGTFRLAWTQSVTRTRWLVVKFVLLVLAAIAAAGLLSLMATWWFSPLDRVEANRFDPTEFTSRALVPAAYAAFAVGLGTSVGVLVRRTLPAMAITLVVFVGAVLTMSFWVRPHLLPPVTIQKSVAAAGGFGFTSNASGTGLDFIVEPPAVPNAWVLSSSVVDSDGHRITPQFLKSACPQLPAPEANPGLHHAPADKSVFLQCVGKIAQTYHIEMTYQPAGRYWIFQSMESGIFVVLALALGAFSVWWVRRRVV